VSTSPSPWTERCHVFRLLTLFPTTSSECNSTSHVMERTLEELGTITSENSRLLSVWYGFCSSHHGLVSANRDKPRGRKLFYV